MCHSIHFTTKRFLLKYKVVLFYKYIFVPCGNMPKISVFSPNTGKYAPEKTPYLDTFHALFSKPRRVRDPIQMIMRNLCLSMKVSVASIKTFVLDKIKIAYDTMKSQHQQRAMWKCGSLKSIVYLNFIAPDSTLLTFNSKRFMYRTYFVKFKFRGYWELKKSDYIHGHLGSLGPKKGKRYYFFCF